MAENFIAEAFALLAIGLVVIGLRLYSRCLSVGFRRLAFDDFLMIIAGVRCEYCVIDPRFADDNGSVCIRQRQWLPMSWAHTGRDMQTTA